MTSMNVAYRSPSTALAALILAAATSLALAQERPPQIDCTAPGSNPEIRECLERQAKVANAELNQVYQAVIADIKSQTHLNTNQRRDWERAMREAQRHWLAFTAKDCGEVMGWEWYQGTGQRTASLTCQVTRTRQRTDELKERYEKK